MGFTGGTVVKNSPASAGDARDMGLIPGSWIPDSLEHEMAKHSRILAWKIPRTEEPGGLYSPWGCKESDMAEQTHAVFYELLVLLTLRQVCQALVLSAVSSV